MKLIEANRSVLTNLENSLAFSLSSNTEDQALVMDLLLSKMYSQPVLSACRELICNAIDANIEAGNGDKEVTVKFEDDNLILEDQGPGLSPDRIVNIYTKFGSSTKRDENKSIGGFGIGAKSIFCLSDTAALTTTHKGKTYNYVLWLDDKKIPCISLVNTEETNLPSGTTIKAPITSRRAEDCARLAACLAETSTVPIKIVLNEVRESYNKRPHYTALDKDIYLHKPTEGTVIPFGIVIGGITYPHGALGTRMGNYFDLRTRESLQHRTITLDFRGESYNTYNFNHCLLLTFEIGELALSASREYVLETEQNKKAIHEKLLRASKHMAHMQEELNQCKNWKSYLQKRQSPEGLFIGRMGPLPLIEGGKSIVIKLRIYGRRDNDTYDYYISKDGYRSIISTTHVKDGVRIDLTKNSLTVEDMLYSNVYVVRPKDKLSIAEEHKDNHIIITLTNFNNSFCTGFDDILIYPALYKERAAKYKERLDNNLSSLEALLKNNKLRYVVPKDLSDDKVTVLSVARTLRELHENTSTFVYITTDDVFNNRIKPTSLKETCEAFELPFLYVLPFTPTEGLPSSYVHLFSYLTNYVESRLEGLCEWRTFVRRLLERLQHEKVSPDFQDYIELATTLENHTALSLLNMVMVEKERLLAAHKFNYRLKSTCFYSNVQRELTDYTPKGWICFYGIPQPEDPEVAKNYRAVVWSSPEESSFWTKVIVRAYRDEM